MARRDCPSCGGPVDTMAKTCPRCGAINWQGAPHQFVAVLIVLGIVFGVVLLGFHSCGVF